MYWKRNNELLNNNKQSHELYTEWLIEERKNKTANEKVNHKEVTQRSPPHAGGVLWPKQ